MPVMEAVGKINKAESVFISVGNNAKLGYIPTFNFPPLIYCNLSAPCTKSGCYACKGNFNYPNVQDTMLRNSRIWEHSHEECFNQIDAWLYLHPSKFFRWFSSGDIPNENFLYRMCALARKHKETNFMCFTKQYAIVDDYVEKHRIPKNLNIVFSAWDTYVPMNPNNFPVAYVKIKNMKGSIPEDAHECPKYCGNCVFEKYNCWTLKKGESVVFKKH